jgi:hypothetical protein
MGRTLKPLSFTFPPEMVEEIERRTAELNMSRSAYFRHLVRNDLKAASLNQSIGEPTSNESRIRQLEIAVAELQARFKPIRAEVSDFRPNSESSSENPLTHPAEGPDHPGLGPTRKFPEITPEELKLGS